MATFIITEHTIAFAACGDGTKRMLNLGHDDATAWGKKKTGGYLYHCRDT
jgi:hypothetical protein